MENRVYEIEGKEYRVEEPSVKQMRKFFKITDRLSKKLKVKANAEINPFDYMTALYDEDIAADFLNMALNTDYFTKAKAEDFSAAKMQNIINDFFSKSGFLQIK